MRTERRPIVVRLAVGGIVVGGLAYLAPLWGASSLWVHVGFSVMVLSTGVWVFVSAKEGLLDV